MTSQRSKLSQLESELARLVADNDRLMRRAKHATSWLRQNAGAEKDPKAKAAFVEAHNAVLGILEGRFDEQPPDRSHT